MSVSTESEPDNWITVVKGRLDNVSGVPCDKQPGKKTFTFAAMQARYARFEVLSFYGRGAVLQYFDIN